MAEFKTETKYPIKELIDILEANVGKTYSDDEAEGQEFLAKLTGLIRAACYSEYGVVEAYPPDQVSARFVGEHIPYKVLYTLVLGKDDEETKNYVFKIQPCEENVNMAHAMDLLNRYLKATSESTSITSFYINKELRSITRLYNMAYGPFYINEPDRTYSVEELNVLLMHRSIPFFIKSEMTLGPVGMPVQSYSVKECRW